MSTQDHSRHIMETRPNRRRNFMVFVVVGVIIAILIGVLALVMGRSTPIASANEPTPTPSNTILVPTVSGYELHYYSRDKGVAKGYYGPGCIPLQNAGNPTVADQERCKADLLERVKHDPILASSIAEALNILPGVKPGMTDAQIEAVRSAYAQKLVADINLRKKMASDIAIVLGSLTDLKMVRLSGWYKTTTVDSMTGVVSTITVNMNPAKKFALTGRTIDGRVIVIKTDCGMQPSVPVVPPPPPPVVCPPGSYSANCVPCPPGTTKPSCKPPVVCTSGKCNPNGPPIMTDPRVPAPVRGPNPTGKKPQPGPGNPNPGPSGCAGPCPTAAPRPPAPTPTPTPGYTAPPVIPGGGAPAPTPTETAPLPPPPGG
jgi:hypothetical protein